MEQAVNTIVYDEDNRILLVKRADVPVWVLPGGGVDAGEAPDKAAAREVFEESGLIVLDLQLVAIYMPPYPSLLAQTHIFQTRHAQGLLSTSDETTQSAFFKKDELPPNIFYAHLIIINEVEKTSSFPIKRQMHELKLQRLFKELLFHPWISLKYLFLYFYRRLKKQ